MKNPEILFFTEGIFYDLDQLNYAKEWIVEILKGEKFSISSINIIICEEKYLLEINKEFLKRDYDTDVISFLLDEDKEKIGEIYISINRVKENADKYGQTHENELNRVLAHGVLHLIGYQDDSKKRKETMTRKEDHYLKMIKKKNVSRET